MRNDASFGVVVNPRSARGRGARTARKVLQALDARGAGARVITGRDAADCSDQLREACSRDNLRGLILVGGDGLIGLVIQVAEARALPIGIVPAGSGNDFARQFALEHAPKRAVARILAAESRPQTVDLGVVKCGVVKLGATAQADSSTHWFAGGFNVGFDAAVNRRANAITLPIGPLRYQVALILELAKLKSRSFTVSKDGGAPHRFDGLLTTVTNIRTFGGGIPITPDASVYDGKLSVVEVAHARRLRVLSVLGRLARGTHESLSEVTISPIEQVRIEAGDEVAYSDGERVGTGPFEVRVAPGALTLLA